MIVDFHTHVFPDVIAARSIALLAEKASIPAYSDGTLDGLKRSMKASGVTHSVTLPVLTKPSQSGSTNAFAAATNGQDGIVAFGGIHPRCDDYRAELDRIAKLGLLGIKLHPDYQNFYIDDETVYPLLAYAAELGLIIVIHAGMDLGFPGQDIKCTPVRAKQMLRTIRYPNIVLAHMGGHDCWQQVADCLVGEQVYLDTSFAAGKMPDELFLQLVHAHGIGRILFGSDSPWGAQDKDVALIQNMGLCEHDLTAILGGNAARLLGWNT